MRKTSSRTDKIKKILRELPEGGYMSVRRIAAELLRIDGFIMTDDLIEDDWLGQSQRMYKKYCNDARSMMARLMDSSGTHYKVEKIGGVNLYSLNDFGRYVKLNNSSIGFRGTR